MKTLKFTAEAANGTYSYRPSIKEMDFDESNAKHMKLACSRIVGKAKRIADSSIPIFFGGDKRQMDLPVEEQKIQMFIGDKVFNMKAVINTDTYIHTYSLILIK